MARIWMGVPLLAILAFSVVAARAAPAAARAQTERQAPGRVLDAWVSIVEKLVIPAAEALPESRYAYSPSDGEFQGVRTFAGQVKHLAAANYQLGARILGEDPPAGTRGESAPESVRTKAEILEYARGSFAVLHRAAAEIDETNLLEPIPGAANAEQKTRLGLLVDALVHASNHYGQIVEYLRGNGIVPPASR